ncbi:MAG: lysophospholipid acyltransferase family protein [Lutimonas sp.]
MKLIWYLLVKLYVRTGFAFYFKKVEIQGIENVPKNTAVLFVANHQNALIDPLLLGAFMPRQLHFLTRADVFDKPLVRALLSTVNMLPIYRIRDGREGLSKNEEVFQKCFKILNRKGTVLIFPEGNHNIQRRVRILSKGFTRIVFGALDEYGDHELMVVPVGINYTNARKYASNVSLHVGEAIRANDYYQREEHKVSSSALKEAVRDRLKKLTTHIEDQENYDYLETCFEEDEFINPKMVNSKLEQPGLLKPVIRDMSTDFNMLLPLVKANSFFPLLIWKYLKPKITEEEFISTYKFSVGITAFPLFYLAQSGILTLFFGSGVGWTYLGLSLLSVWLLTKSR